MHVFTLLQSTLSPLFQTSCENPTVVNKMFPKISMMIMLNKIMEFWNFRSSFVAKRTG